MLATAAIFLLCISLLSTYFAIDSQRKRVAIEKAQQVERLSLMEKKIALAQQTTSLRKNDSRSKAKELLNEAFADWKILTKNRRTLPDQVHDFQPAITQVLSMPELRITPIPKAPSIGKAIEYACDQNHRRILICDEDGKTCLYSMPDWSQLHTFPSIERKRFVSLSPDGRFGTLGLFEENVSSRTGHGFECWDLTTNPPNRLWKRENLSMSIGFWNASSDILYCMEFDGSILGIEPTSGNVIHKLDPSGPLYEAIIYPHPTLPLIAVATHYFPEIQFRELETGATLALQFEDR
ncbi:MAG: hypothetical protein ACKO8U_08035, partial [Pirellula sp.]